MKIIGAAIRTNGAILTLPPPARHNDIFRRMGEKAARSVRPSDQGFITERCEFVGREEALSIARAAGQLLKETQHAMLFSEDLW